MVSCVKQDLNLYSNGDDISAGLMGANRPVYMTASGSTGGHAWVCDGVRTHEEYTQFYVNNAYTNYYSSYTPSNPKTYTTTYHYYHMNWGWGGTSDDWFYDNNANPGNRNYSTNRQNIYITK